MLAETASVEQGGDKAEWIRRLLAWFESHPAAQALVWFDTNESRSHFDWRIDSSPESMAAFRAMSRTRLFEAGLPLAAAPPQRSALIRIALTCAALSRRRALA